jgi:hypothetical protein
VPSQEKQFALKYKAMIEEFWLDPLKPLRKDVKEEVHI